MVRITHEHLMLCRAHNLRKTHMCKYWSHDVCCCASTTTTLTSKMYIQSYQLASITSIWLNLNHMAKGTCSPISIEISQVVLKMFKIMLSYFVSLSYPMKIIWSISNILLWEKIMKNLILAVYYMSIHLNGTTLNEVI